MPLPHSPFPGSDQISIRLLGECQVARGERYLAGIPFGFYRIGAYLLLEGRGRPALRWRIGRLIWSENDPARASTDLRQAIARIRRFQAAHGFFFLVSDPMRLSLAHDPRVHCDLQILLELLDSPDPTLNAPTICALYDGRLLEVPGTAGLDFEEWLRFQRERLRDRVVGVLSNAIGPGGPLSPTERDVCARHLLSIDPCHEDAYRALMQMAADNGQTSVVRHLFDECTRRLREDLGVAPDEQTVQLYRQLTTQSGGVGNGQAA